MARTRNTVDVNKIEELRKLTYQSFGKPLTHSFETESLSSDIRKLTGVYLSPQTLRRFFRFVDSPFAPSMKTLEALAQYNGFSSWHSFINSGSQNFQPLSLDQEANLYLSFYQIEMQTEGDMNYHNATRNIALRILFNPQLLSKLSASLAKNAVAQVYFFEHFPFIDGLCSEYKRSIRLYLQKKDPSAQVFGNSLLFLSAFLAKRTRELPIKIERINRVTLEQSMHPFTVARYIGSNILYHTITCGDAEMWIEKAREWNQFFLQKGTVGFWRYPYFQHMICDYLNMAGLFEDSRDILRSSRRFGDFFAIENGYPEALDVISHVGRRCRSKEAFMKWFDAKSFQSVHPLFRNYHRLQALCAYLPLARNDKKKQRLLAEKQMLVRQTGFLFFEDYLRET